jgi:hypothetical protein
MNPRILVASLVASSAVACANAPTSPPSETPASTPSAAPSPAASPVASAPAPTNAADASTLASPLAAGAKAVALPGVTGPASLDYIAVDRARGKVWVPVGNTGSVDVLDVASGAFTRVDGFATAQREYKGKTRTMGPSAVSIGDGVAFIGNRATSEVCMVDAATLKPGACVKLPSATDGVGYAASVKEVWVTTPRDRTVTVLDASHPGALTVKTTIKFDGDPEGYGFDETRGLFFTNLEDKGPTVAVDLETHKIKSTWNAGCGADGPRGLSVDAARGFVIVACTDHVQVLDAAHDGAKLGRFDTGPGVDNLDYLETKGLVYAAAGKAGQITVARIGDKGDATVVKTIPTSESARNAVADANGTMYVADSKGARLLIVAP